MLITLNGQRCHGRKGDVIRECEEGTLHSIVGKGFLEAVVSELKWKR